MLNVLQLRIKINQLVYCLCFFHEHLDAILDALHFVCAFMMNRIYCFGYGTQLLFQVWLKIAKFKECFW